MNSDPCEESGRVCIHKCSNGRTIYLADFVKHSVGSETSKTNAFNEACLEGGNLEFTEKMKKMAVFVLTYLHKEAQPSTTDYLKANTPLPANKKYKSYDDFLQHGTSYKYYVTYEKELNAKSPGQLMDMMKNSKSNAMTVIYGLIQILKSFKKICKNDRQRFKGLSRKMQNFIETGYKELIDSESNRELKKLFISNYDKYLKASDDMIKDHESDYYLIVKLTKSAYTEFITKSEDSKFCVCKEYMSQPGISLSPSTKIKIDSICKVKVETKEERIMRRRIEMKAERAAKNAARQAARKARRQ